jgi:hypothetical protein
MFAGDVDVAAVYGAVMPLGFENVVVCEQHAADDSENDEEDASASVFSGSRRRPLAGEQWCAVVVGEGHGHGVRHAAAGRRGGAHIHAGHIVAAVIHGVYVYVVCRRLLRSWRSLDNALRCGCAGLAGDYENGPWAQVYCIIIAGGRFRAIGFVSDDETCKARRNSLEMILKSKREER